MEPQYNILFWDAFFKHHISHDKIGAVLMEQNLTVISHLDVYDAAIDSSLSLPSISKK